MRIALFLTCLDGIPRPAHRADVLAATDTPGADS